MTYRFMRWLVRFIARTYLAGGLLEVDGVENVPRSGALLVCGNHTSTVDPPLLPAFLPRVDSWSMGKKEYFDNWFVNWLFRRYHAFPVVRHTADRAALRRATEILRAGKVLVLYPEGTRITQGGLHRPEPGAGFLAKLTGAPILPVGTEWRSGSASPSSCGPSPAAGARTRRSRTRSCSRSLSCCRPSCEACSQTWKGGGSGWAR